MCSDKESVIFKGLRVTDYEDHHDYFHMTSFDVRFSVPGVDPELNADALKFIQCGMYLYLINHNYSKEDIVNFGKVEKSAVTFALSPYLNKTDAFNLIIRMCYSVLALADMIPTEETDFLYKSEKGVTDAKVIVTSFLREITRNGKYRYSEENV